MKSRRFKMKMDRRVKWITFIAMILIICSFAYLYITSGGSYLPAWFTMLILALLALLALSIPKFVSVSDKSLEIHCVMELTQIKKENIKSIEQIDNKDMKWCLPIPMLGVWGVFGYYGYYFDIKNFKIFKLYAKQWGNFIRIEDIYEDITVISSVEKEEIAQIMVND